MKDLFGIRTLGAVALVCSGLLVQSQAQVVTLKDQNSVARIDFGAQRGMFDWSVENQDSQLRQQWFWYRIGAAPQFSIDTIGAPVITLNNGTRGVTAVYTHNLFNLSIDYLLTGGVGVGVGQTAISDIGETIRIINTSSETLRLNFFQYSDFNLGGTGSGDTVQLGTNLRGLYNEAVQSRLGVGLTETVTTPGANHGEAAVVPYTLDRLNGPIPINLDDTSYAGPGDVSWALQWDFSIAPGSSAIISKDKYLSVVVIPEPSTLALVGIGLVAILIRNRRTPLV